MAVNMNDVESIVIPQGDLRAIHRNNVLMWSKQEYVDIDLLPYVQDNVGWWNLQWTSCNGFGSDTNWSWGSACFPVAEGSKITYKLYLHNSVGHLTAWNSSGTQLGYICGTNGRSMQQSEWELPTGTRWVRICIAYPEGSIGRGRDQNVHYVGKNPIPRRYQALDHITSTGTQYIDTGLTPNADHLIDMWLTPTEPTGDSKFFGMYGGGIAGAFLGCYNNKWRIGSGLKNSSIPITGDKIRVRNQGSTWYWGNLLEEDVHEGCTSIATGNNTYLLFGCRYGGTGQAAIQFGKMQCHWLQIGIRRNVNYPLAMGNPSLSLLPAKDLTDGTLGMYDLVSGNFLTNLGTGSFTE